MFSQLVGVVPRKCAKRIAISGVRGLCSFSISEIVRRDTPNRKASSAYVMFNSGKISSRKIAPGCVGLRFLDRNVRISDNPPNQHHGHGRLQIEK